jgi:hypothetical protein
MLLDNNLILDNLVLLYFIYYLKFYDFDSDFIKESVIENLTKNFI